MAYTYNIERIDEARPELDALLIEHYREIALYQDKVPLAPNWASYYAMERAAQLVLVSARKEGVLVGYAAWLLKDHLHYQGHLVAMNDVIFLAKEHRRGRTGLRLIDESEYLLKVLGVDRIMWHIKPSNDWSPILKRKGYQVEEFVLGKYTGA